MLLQSGYGAVIRPIPARLAPALLALAATLLSGAIALPFAPRWHWFESAALLPVIGLVFASAAGLLACHLALLSVAPRPSRLASALPAALIAGALPGLGAAALLVPAMLAAYAAFRGPARKPALCGLGGATLALFGAGLHGPILPLAGSLAMLAAATLLIRRAARPAVNDNVHNAPFTAFWRLPEDPLRARQPARTSSPVLGE
ncbi:hypothetical protein Q9Q95_08960 [Sphingomonas sp. DG1-23]|uniref:hypothetical protein n=1 Tax=Sphingomonas sp. DG1-23 TaxID=3068316 RepID=UPI00273D1E86|nr:hypothetical protein [Sphingomonas sp. DG1-23]MDP5279052.1 hypothetical protein [Sphingomonas sp. DG1-23]